MNEDTIAQKLNMRPLQDTQEMLDKLDVKVSDLPVNSFSTNEVAMDGELQKSVDSVKNLPQEPHFLDRVQAHRSFCFLELKLARRSFLYTFHIPVNI